MIGNDIVDLLQAGIESNWQRKGYLQKLFTAEEQQLIHGSATPAKIIWLLWTMKESVYKIESRMTQWNAFAPIRIVCKTLMINDGMATGRVICRQQEYFTQSILSDNFIHTIAGRNYPFEPVKISISKYDPKDHTYRNTLPLSVSHHGRYLALAY